MRVLFAGSPAIAVPTLEAIAASRHRIVGVLTNPESHAGRGLRRAKMPVAEAAERLLGNSVPIFTFETLRSEARQAVSACAPDILVSFAYGRLFGPKFMALFSRGGINVHPSLLPRWRGSSPIQHAILEMDAETGISIQSIAPEMDTGDLYLVQRIPLSGRETARTLSELCGLTAAPLAVQVLDAIEEGRAQTRPQEGTPTYCRMISKEDGRIDWSQPARIIDARIRAFDPWPGTFTFFRGQQLNILEASPLEACQGPSASWGMTNALPGTIIAVDMQKGIIVSTGEGFLAITRLQRATRNAVGFREFANGVRDLAGTVLGQ